MPCLTEHAVHYRRMALRVHFRDVVHFGPGPVNVVNFSKHGRWNSGLTCDKTMMSQWNGGYPFLTKHVTMLLRNLEAHVALAVKPVTARGFSLAALEWLDAPGNRAPGDPEGRGMLSARGTALCGLAEG